MSPVRQAAILLLLVLFSLSATAADLCSITEPSSVPAAVDDIVYVETPGVAVRIPVLDNDSIPAGITVSVVSVSGAAHGTVVRNADNTVTYTPSVIADDSFTYTIADAAAPASAQSEATVRVAPKQDIQIDAEYHGGDYLFDARPRNPVGIARYTWTFGDGTSWVGSARAFHQYRSEGNYEVTVRADYYSGAVANGRYTASVRFQKDLAWTLTIDGLGARVEVDYDSLKTFPGGPEAAQVGVSFSDNTADCPYACGPTGTWMPCYPYCQPVGEAYYRTGTYKVRVTVKDSTNTTHTYAKFATVVNQPPIPDFKWIRPDKSIREYEFDPSLSKDEFGIDSDPQFAPGPYEWDFGDGMTAVTDGPTKIKHLYTQPGDYVVTLRLTDPGGEVGFQSRTVTVTNEAPAPHIRVNCKLFDCTFGVEGSLDDGNDITRYDWNFGDGNTATGALINKRFNAAGCYVVSLKATDGAGANATVTLTVPVGPSVFATAGGAVVDAHVQSYQWSSKWYTSKGNLNGILEPGETAVVEPNWRTTASTTPISVLARGWTSTDWSYANPGFRDFVQKYDVTTGTTDCWTTGRCYVIDVASNPAARNTNQPHNDISFDETYLSSGAPTPGSPIRIHIGASFTDVPVSHWAYGHIESILHAGIDGGTGGLTFTPAREVTRAEIAKWVLKAKYGASYTPPACTTAPFTDVPCTHAEAAWIAQVKADGISAGTGNGAYSPDAKLTRAELSVFVLRAKLGGTYAPPACTFDFGDAPCPQHWASAWISEIKRRGISSGCANNEFCPDSKADRATVAAFITRAFNLSIDARQCANASQYDVVQGHVPRPPIVSLTFNPSPVVVNSTSTGTLTIGLATPNGVTIPLSIDNPAAASIPSTVFIKPGEFSATFTVTPANVSVRTPTFITATYLGATKTTQLDVCTLAPVISAQPTSRIIFAGQPTTLNVTASGGGTLTYKWYQGTAPSTTTPVGSNNAALTVSPAVTTNYWVNVANACSGTNSVTATVTVCNYPTIAVQPMSDVIVTGSTATLTVTAGGSGPFSYQWYEGPAGTTTTPVGTNSSTFTTPALTANKTYWVRVTSTCNGVTPVDSTAATITVVTQVTRRQLAANIANSLPSATTNWTRPTQAGSLLVAVVSASTVGNPTTFTMPAGWQLATSYEFNYIKTSIYYIPHNAGGRTSETVSVGASNFRDIALQLLEYVGATATPLDKTAFNGDHTPAGGLVTTGMTPVTAQAKELVISALTSNAVTNFTSPSDSFVRIDQRQVMQNLTTAVHERIVTTTGSYGHSAAVEATDRQWVGVIATFKSIDGCTSTPVITAQPTSRTITGGNPTTLTVTATNATTYRWYQGTAPSTTTPVGTNSNSLTVTPSATTNYWVQVSNACGAVNSATATVTVCAPLGIATQPASQTINSGTSATLSVTPSGSGPFTYQWYEGAAGTTTLPVGTNSSTFTTPALTATKSYWVRITSACNGTASVNSNTATITVTAPVTLGRRQFAASAVNSQLSIATNWTQPTQPGTLLVAVISASSSFYPIANWTVPAGWQLAATYEWNNVKTSIYYYANNPGGRTSESFGTGGANMFRDQTLALAEYTGVATVSPLDRTAFNGDHTASGTIETGYTANTVQAKELVITALTSYANTSFYSPSQGFVELDDRIAGNRLTTAVHEKLVTTIGSWGHYASVDATEQWVGLVVTFKSAN